MPRRLLALILGLSLLTGCGARGDGRTPAHGDAGSGPSSGASAGAVGAAEAAQAFELLQGLGDAWRDRDCAAVGRLTAWAEETLGGRACEATRNGRPAPATAGTLGKYAEPEFLLPASADEDRWFVALAREPDPAYFLFVDEGDGWRLGAGPIPATGDTVPGTASDAASDAVPEAAASSGSTAAASGTGVRARLVPQRYLTYLTDPAGVSGVTFPEGDAAARLRADLGVRRTEAAPDRLTTDVRLVVGPRRVIPLRGGALVVHALEIEYRQRPRPGRSSLSRPVHGGAELRAFTGRSRAAELTGTEIVLLVTGVGDDGEVSTVASRRALADLTAK
ncbi:hypothetical protein [Planomonospora parontospora]|uniref:hypothetical protein n=1 Tax=Planomonospora parontospora TaxID=58119 RepID=UPI00166FFEB8|nr:hypothetical protein [Planomonospora parontospora]GGL09520.1 hypothetical protein GCM10014719_09480 [Planomonospora parontospora subsp. antibiotica]GII14398.1 hypothetical protein Ppa05_11240 [Planomonospora parontospora subsp. antibiotica]